MSRTRSPGVYRALSATLLAALISTSPAFATTDKIEATPIPVSIGTRPGPTGPMSEETWRLAPIVGGFLQREPREGAEPSQATEFRVMYDSATLFVKVHAYDREPERIVSYLTRRDDDCPCDWIRVLVDSFHDRRTAYEFAVNPSGVKQDRYWYNDNNNDSGWDAVWDVSVSRDPSGWSAEFRIPLTQLRFSAAESNTFGFAVVRDIGRLRETSSWPLLARSASGYVSSFGEIDGLAVAARTRGLELMPYTVASLTRQRDGGNPLQKPSAPNGALGLDLKYALTSGLMLTATVNPDFGQVEADPAVVNLSAFETFFSEQRPFFVEGSGNFRFDADCYDGCNNMFYSRRIGRAPQGEESLPTGDTIYSLSPPQTSIIGAAKMTGRIGRYAVGVMQAATKEASADVLDGSASSRLPVEPMTGYSVARVRREFANQSYVGFIGTATKRSATSTLSFLTDSAVVGGLDYDWRLLTRYSLNGFWEGSRLHGSAEAIDRIQENPRHYFQRPDSRTARLDPTRTSLTGTAGAIAISKISGQRVRFNSSFNFRSPGFDSNDLGFLRRADQRAFNGWFQLRSEKPTRWFRSRFLNFNHWRGWNFDGERLFSGANVNGNVQFTNNWQVGGGVGKNQDSLDDRAARGGPAFISNGGWNRWFWVNSDNRRPVSLNLGGNLNGDGKGTSWRELNPVVTVRPVPAVLFSFGARVTRNIVDAQWLKRVTDTRDREVFARLDQTTVSMTARLNYTMSPNLSLQLYGAPFVSAGAYSGFRQLTDGRRPEYVDRYSPFAYSPDADGNPDFNVKSFRTTNVVRWEYRPGSTLFVVWQQARENDGVPDGFRFGRDARDIFAVPPRNVFLVKLAYWFSY